MGIWRRGVVVGRTYGKKRMKKQVLNKNRHGRNIERQLRQLQKIIPGGGATGQVVDVETLFQKIAVYIFLLESRVKLLKGVLHSTWP
ncbi:hypothetical protein L2E82_03449 [Cichorium intybus]|uniref:Uncharacterized protein n=1 Tax=Cichorium intybus TaxID=13427 RepID=A0ACB9H3W6_CICIN|nr:hypothetical protein L2E82_03449 [Cichorium intybus]